MLRRALAPQVWPVLLDRAASRLQEPLSRSATPTDVDAVDSADYQRLLHTDLADEAARFALYLNEQFPLRVPPRFEARAAAATTRWCTC